MYLENDFTKKVSAKMLKKIEVLVGRFQPFHNGHKQIIREMKNPVIVLVKGSKSKIEKNPLNVEYQKFLIQKCFPDIEISISPNGFIPGIVGYFRKQNKDVVKIYAGSDRLESYKQAITKANEKMPNEMKYDITFQETPRTVSATEVREAIYKNDNNHFTEWMPPELWSEWTTLRDKIV